MDVHITQFNVQLYFRKPVLDTHSYVVTIFNETDSLDASFDFVKGVKQFVATFMQEMEAAATGT